MKNTSPTLRLRALRARRSSLVLLALISGLLQSTPLSAQTVPVPGSFRQIDLQGGGWVTGTAVKNADSNYRVLYARTDVGGIYRSVDAGVSWIFLSGNMSSPGGLSVQGVAIGNYAWTVFQAVGSGSYSPDPNHGFTDINRGVWKSTNGGDAWTKVLPNVTFGGNNDLRIGGECIIVKPGSTGSSPETVWAGSRGQGLWRSTNAGNVNTWTEVAPNVFNVTDGFKLNFSSLFIAPNRTGEVWAGGDKGLFVSTDANNNTWTRLPMVGLDAQLQPIPFKVWRIVRLLDGTAIVGITYGKYRTRWQNAINTPVPTADANYLYKITATNWANPATYQYVNITAEFILADGRSPIASASQFTGLAVLAGTVGVHDHAGKLLVKPNQDDIQVADTTTLPWTWTRIDVKPLPENPATGYSWPQWMDPTTAGVNPFNHITQDTIDPNRWYGNSGFSFIRSDRVLSATPSTVREWRHLVSGIGEVVGQPPTFDPSDPRRVYLPVGDIGAAVIVDGGLKADGTVNPEPNAILHGNYKWPDSHAYSFRVLLDNVGKAFVFGGLFDESNGVPNGRLWSTDTQGAKWNIEIPFVADTQAIGLPPLLPTAAQLASQGLALGPVGSAPRTHVAGTFQGVVATSPNLSSYIVSTTGMTKKFPPGHVGLNPYVTGIDAGGVYYTENGPAGNATRYTQAVISSTIAFPANGLMVGHEWAAYTQFERDSADANTVYLAYTVEPGQATAGAGLYRSTGTPGTVPPVPTGKTWVRLTHPSAQWVGNNFRLAVDSRPDSSGSVGVPIPRLWVAGEDVSIGLKFSNNRGVLWNSVSGFTSAQDVSARDGIICVLGKRGSDLVNRIYLSSDNGATWNDEITRENFRFGTAKYTTLSPHVAGQVWITTGGRSYGIFTPTTTLRNLLGNPSFESDLSGWGFNSNAVTSVQTGGVFGIKVARMGAIANGGLTRTETLTSPLPAKIKLVFWAKPSANLGYNLSASLVLKTATNAVLTSQAVLVGGSTAWKRYETAVIDVSAHPTATRAEVLFWKPGSAAPSNTVDVDHVEIVRVPTFVPAFTP